MLEGQGTRGGRFVVTTDKRGAGTVCWWREAMIEALRSLKLNPLPRPTSHNRPSPLVPCHLSIVPPPSPSSPITVSRECLMPFLPEFHYFRPMASTNSEDLFKNIISHAKGMGLFSFQWNLWRTECCLWLRTEWSQLKKNIREFWWKAMVQMNENIVGIDAAIFMHPTTWKASGHVDAFNDLVDNKDSKKIPCRCAHWRSCGKNGSKDF